MQLTDTQLITAEAGNSAKVEPASIVASSATVNASVLASDRARFLSEFEGTPKPLSIEGSVIELMPPDETPGPVQIKLTGVATQLGTATVGLGTDCPAGTATPTWVKITINGVECVIPAFPL